MFDKTKDKSAEQKPLTYWQRKDLEKAVEAKKKRNIFLSRRSGEEGGTSYQTSRASFMGGEVESRSRVSLVGQNSEGEVGRSAVGRVRSKLGFAKAATKSTKTGFAKSTIRASAGGTPASRSSSRPLGFN